MYTVSVKRVHCEEYSEQSYTVEMPYKYYEFGEVFMKKTYLILDISLRKDFLCMY